MRILFVTSAPLEYSASANIRNLALIEGLISSGNEVELVSAMADRTSPFYDSSLADKIRIRRFIVEPGRVYTSVSSKTFEGRSRTSRFRKRISSLLYKSITSMSVYDPRKSLVKQAKNLRFEGPYDLMISSSDPKSSHLLARRIMGLNPSLIRKWTQYWGDPFIDDVSRTILLPKRLIEREEKKLLCSADSVVYVSSFTHEIQVSRFPEFKDKLHFLPVPYLPRSEIPRLRNDKFTIGYFGEYYSKNRNILPLYNVIRKDSDCFLHIAGGSDIQLEKAHNVEILPRIDSKGVEEIESKCDLLVCVCNKTGSQIPGKVYHYAGTSKPILIALDGENKARMRTYFDHFERFVCCDNNEQSIRESIKKIILEGNHYEPSPHFSPNLIASKFIEFSYPQNMRDEMDS